MKSRLLTIIIRGISQFSKFLLLIFLAKNFTLSEVGIYGLFASSIVVATYLIGFDFYTYSQRKILEIVDGSISHLISNHFFLVFGIYVVGMPINYLLFYFDVIPKHLLLIYYLILFFELFSQESYRVLIALNLQVQATLLFFLKGGFWVLILFLYIFITSQLPPNLVDIFYFWLFGTFTSIILSIFYLYKHINFKKIIEQVNFSWIKNGIFVAFPFLISTLFLRVLFSFDRYSIDYFFSKETVGIYTFFIGISNIVVTFVEAGAIIHIYPNLIKFYKQDSLDNYYREIRKLSVSIVLLSIVIIILLVVFIEPLLVFISKGELLAEIRLFWILLLAMFFLNLSNIPHYVCYAKNEDSTIILATIISAIVVLVGYYFLVPIFSFYGVGISLVVGFLLMFILKLRKSYKDIRFGFK